MTTTTVINHGKKVNTKHVDELIRNYKKERWIHNSNKLGKEDALSTWYGLEELEAFIAEAREHGADGIKMYYGVYAADFAGDPVFQGRQTVVLVATKQKTSAAGIPANKDIYIQGETGSEILAFNYGSLCPPYCGTIGDDGEMGSIGISLIDNKENMIVF
ncbi:hypothetical protein [Sediminibacterium ginsengisoli]|uniref:Uncharacterized protein n=1 Tax=Sediminibacterium ginsengisoli TaxID=413434 RepID=A0A1T4PA13_9BACT|nr:hypothetical protein [Sediminibacterium ginsengisoli]SJZ88400.1 hypothetical protein SAMN04488132_105236 [Sediminibacterium ginsengisoli]